MCRIYVLITKQPIDNRIQQNFSFWEDTAGTHQYEGVGIRNQMEPRTGSRKFCWKDKRRDASTLHMIFESDGSIAWHKWDWKLRTTEKIVLTRRLPPPPRGNYRISPTNSRFYARQRTST